jgi:hypothetical protein
VPGYGIIDLLASNGFDATQRYKLVRHSPAASDVYSRGLLEIYQAFQYQAKFDDLDCIVVFLGERNSTARFVGIFDIVGHAPGLARETGILIAKGLELPWKDPNYYYALRKRTGWGQLENRVVIDWGPGALSWVQRPTNKPVIDVP